MLPPGAQDFSVSFICMICLFSLFFHHFQYPLVAELCSRSWISPCTLLYLQGALQMLLLQTGEKGWPTNDWNRRLFNKLARGKALTILGFVPKSLFWRSEMQCSDMVAIHMFPPVLFIICEEKAQEMESLSLLRLPHCLEGHSVPVWGIQTLKQRQGKFKKSIMGFR